MRDDQIDLIKSCFPNEKEEILEKLVDVQEEFNFTDDEMDVLFCSNCFSREYFDKYFMILDKIKGVKTEASKNYCKYIEAKSKFNDAKM